MKTQEVEFKINELIKERLFGAIRKIIIKENREKFLRSTEYIMSNHKSELLDKRHKQWFASVSELFLSYKSILALHPLVIREEKIEKFTSEEVVRVKADYFYDGIEFSAVYPTHFSAEMTREIDDCIAYLKEPSREHTVESYVSKESEKQPRPPLTTAALKFSAFYLYGIEPKETTAILNKLFGANLITDPITNGWNIDYQSIEDIQTLLFGKYEEDQILQYQRKYEDKAVDRSQECIRPVNFSSAFLPKKIIETKEYKSIKHRDIYQEKATLNLYMFIYYITLSTQMKNSYYDTSTLEITVGGKKLKEQASSLIEGSENWEELTGSIVARLDKNADIGYQRDVVLPELANDTILTPSDVYSYSYQSKRPPRYGVGRFITQILEKKGVGGNVDHDAIISDLLTTNAVKQVKSMLHPQDSGIKALNWIQQHASSLLCEEYHVELKDKIELVVSKSITIKSLLEEINDLIDGAFSSADYIADDLPPSDKKIMFAKKIAVKNNVVLSRDILNSAIKLDMFIANYPQEELVKVGMCPSCNSKVYHREYLDNKTGEISYFYACENNNNKESKCNFSLWSSSIKKFFSLRGIELFSEDEVLESVKKILPRKKGYLFSGFISRSKKEYDAKVFIESYIQKDSTTESYKLSLTPIFNKKAAA